MSLVALLDIGSTSVGASLVVPGKKGDSKVTRTVRKEVAFQDEVNLERFLASVSDVIKETLSELIAAGHRPKEVFAFLSAPFYASQTKILGKKEKEPFTFSAKLLKELAEKEISQFKKDKNHEVVESEVLDIKLNGYQVAEPFGQEALELEARHFLSVSAEEILKRFRESIAGVVQHQDIYFHSFSYSLYRALGRQPGTPPDYLIADLSGEIVELSLVWHGALQQTTSYPFGHNWLIRQLAKTLGTSAAEAQSTLRLWREKKISPAALSSVESALTKLKAEWLAAFREALGRVILGALLPDKLYILADPEVLPVAQSWLAGEKFQSATIGHREFAVSVIAESALETEKRFYDIISASS